MKKLITIFLSLIMITMLVNVAVAAQEDSSALQCPEGWGTIFFQENHDDVSNSSLLICTKNCGDESDTNELMTHLLLERDGEITRYNLTLSPGCASSPQRILLGAMSGLQLSLDGESELFKKVFAEISFDLSHYSDVELEDVIQTFLSSETIEDFKRFRKPMLNLNVDICHHLGQDKESFTLTVKEYLPLWAKISNERISCFLNKSRSSLIVKAFMERVPHLEESIKKVFGSNEVGS
ncbi:MAG: hypothetical protein WB791_10370 [Waddliaceae bacterium]